MDYNFEKLSEIAQSSAQKEKFARAANRLLNQCFILKKKDDTKQDYYFIKDNKNIFSSFFDLIGYDIKIDEDLGLVSSFNRQGTGSRGQCRLYLSLCVFGVSASLIVGIGNLFKPDEQLVVVGNVLRGGTG